MQPPKGQFLLRARGQPLFPLSNTPAGLPLCRLPPLAQQKTSTRIPGRSSVVYGPQRTLANAMQNGSFTPLMW